MRKNSGILFSEMTTANRTTRVDKLMNQPENAQRKTSRKGLFKKFMLYALPVIGAAAVWLICITLRKSVENQHWEKRARDSGKGAIYVFWHGRLLYFAHYYRGSKGNILVSQSDDGEFIARVIKLLGFRLVRGSKSGGGLQAFRQISRMLRNGEYVAVTPDGPRGPGFRVHEGVITLASTTGSPILPMTTGFRKKKIFKSWDRFVLPCPFTRVRIIYGEPLFVPHTSDAGILESRRLQLEKTLNEITTQADNAFS